MNAPPIRNPETVSILRAAAGEGDTLYALPAVGSEFPPVELFGDPLTAWHGPARHRRPEARTLPDSTRRSLGLFLGTTTGSRECRDLGDLTAHAAKLTSTLRQPRRLCSHPPQHASPPEISVKLQLRGPLITLSAGDASTALALQRAALWMHHHALDFILAGGMDWQASPEFPGAAIPRAAFALLSHLAARNVIGPPAPRPLSTHRPISRTKRLFSDLPTPAGFAIPPPFPACPPGFTLNPPNRKRRTRAGPI